jgi:hypothetical protein
MVKSRYNRRFEDHLGPRPQGNWGRGQRWSSKRRFYLRLTIWRDWKPGRILLSKAILACVDVYISLGLYMWRKIKTSEKNIILIRNSFSKYFTSTYLRVCNSYHVCTHSCNETLNTSRFSHCTGIHSCKYRLNVPLSARTLIILKMFFCVFYCKLYTIKPMYVPTFLLHLYVFLTNSK